MIVDSIMRSEILDETTCEICENELDGIVLPADDPAWGGELSMLAHPNCRMMLVPIFEGIEPVLRPTPIEDIQRVIRHFGALVPEWLIEQQTLPVTGRRALAMVPVTVEDIEDVTEQDELVTRLFGWGE